MSSEAYRALARRFFSEQDRLRGGPAPELCAPGYTAHLVGNPALDLAGHQAFAAAFYAGFPDLRHQVEGEFDQLGLMGQLTGENAAPVPEGAGGI